MWAGSSCSACGPALKPSGRAGDLHGAAFGFVAYATYDLTNQATLNGWPLAVSLVDMTWGTMVGAWPAARDARSLCGLAERLIARGIGQKALTRA